MSLEDKLYPLLQHYKKSPYFIKNAVGRIYNILPKRLKYGSFYYTYLNRIYNYNPEIHTNLLAEQLNFAVQNISHYKGFKFFEDLNDFPIINKPEIRKNFNNLYIDDNAIKLLSNSGGSSGKPIQFYLHKGISRSKEQAHFDWFWGQFGYTYGEPILMIRGESLQNNKLFEIIPIGNKLALSCYLLNESNIRTVIKAINKFSPKFIHGYPSAVKNFTRLLIDTKLKINNKIQGIFLGSEGLYPGDKILFENYYNSKVVNWYGHSEKLIHAGNCPYSDEYHVYPFYGHIELLNSNNEEIMPGETGKIIATGFDNKCMPLIRYDTEDEAQLSGYTECECGFKGISLKQIIGRKQDYIYLNDRTKVSITAFVFGQHFEEFSKIKELQFEQKQAGEILIRLNPINDWTMKDEDSLINKMKKSVDNKIKIFFELVDFIPKTIRGKHKFIIQHLDETGNSKL